MNKQQLKITGITSTLIIVASILFFTLNYLLPYVGGAIFISTLLIGFLPPYLAGGKHPMHKIESFSLSFIALGIMSSALLTITYSTILFYSILVVLPLLFPVVLFFSYLAFRINDKKVFRVKDFFR